MTTSYKLLTSIIILLLMGTTLTACSTTKKPNNKSSSSTISKQSSKLTSSSSSASTQNSTPTANLSWSNVQDKQLSQFMAAWGPAMHQIYKQYSPSNNVKFNGINFPDEFQKNDIAVEDTPVSIEYSTNGTGTKDYEVVAVYSDAEYQISQHQLDQHLYLFAIHDKQPVALVTEQSQGLSDNKIHFTETKNVDVATNFTSIFNGQGVKFKGGSQNSSSNSSASSRNSTGVFAGLDEQHLAATLYYKYLDSNNLQDAIPSSVSGDSPTYYDFDSSTEQGNVGTDTSGGDNSFSISNNNVTIVNHSDSSATETMTELQTENYYQTHKMDIDTLATHLQDNS
ncbi:DUF4767 domain-containing protein [Furfurilactobacillus cerevisiae]|uniref:DUF4767 domain-containing protein n=1 Tax=Furfurilactobacillus rossiae TaxID=231049 RepID=UPI003B97D4CD